MYWTSAIRCVLCEKMSPDVEMLHQESCCGDDPLKACWTVLEETAILCKSALALQPTGATVRQTNTRSYSKQRSLLTTSSRSYRTTNMIIMYLNPTLLIMKTSLIRNLLQLKRVIELLTHCRDLIRVGTRLKKGRCIVSMICIDHLVACACVVYHSYSGTVTVNMLRVQSTVTKLPT